MQNINHNLDSLITKEKTPSDKLKNSYREILCPLSREEIQSAICSECEHCQVQSGNHHSGRSLVALICLYGQNNGSE
ncbi:MAG: hypothetical protein ACFFDW_16950 [Candidatus Thorarchaeota archaeon]